MKLPVNQIICGSALEVLKTLPSESINCCISSPPFWALRDYGTEPQIWDGDKDCKHNFELSAPPRRSRNENDVTNPNSKQATVGGSNYNAKNSQFCSKCGAWIGNLGLEPTFELYIKHLCDIYDEVKRVLRKDGTCFVNLGDTYASSPAGNKGHIENELFAGTPKGENYRDNLGVASQCKKNIKLPAKSLCLIPQRFAIEMVNRGWIVRNVLIWHKPNPMPSSAKDRFTVDFEYVIFMTKSNTASYYVHPRKMRSSSTKKSDYIWTHRNTGLEVNYQPFSDRVCKGKKRLWNRRNLWEGRDYWFEPQYEPHNTPIHLQEKRVQAAVNSQTKRVMSGDGDALEKWSIKKPEGNRINPLGRNKRCVWTIPTQAYKNAHFATYPEKLVEPMILAGCPEFVCSKCGKARVKVYERIGGPPKGSHTKNFDCRENPQNRPNEKRPYGADLSRIYAQYGYAENKFIGYTDCGCNAEWRPGIVLDMFRRCRDYVKGSRPVAA